MYHKFDVTGNLFFLYSALFNATKHGHNLLAFAFSSNTHVISQVATIFRLGPILVLENPIILITLYAPQIHVLYT
jgi:hypothetical protein